ncbi:DNA N-6-adenine-methyltransferase [Pasteurella multocida]
MSEMDFNRDHYRTPKYIFNWLRHRHGWFHIDGCATEENALAPHWIGPGSDVCEDFLSDDLLDVLLEQVIEQADLLRFYVNPPYSDPLPFVKRAAELRNAGYVVVMLLPADKTVEWYKVVQDNANEVIDIIGYYDEKNNKYHSGRIRFINPKTGKEVAGNNKGSMIVVFDPFVEGFFTRQVSLKLIKEWGCPV